MGILKHVFLGVYLEPASVRRAMSALAQGPPPPRLPCEALSLRGSACHERRPQSLREDAPRHTTPATSPPRGGGVSGSGPREGGWAGTPGGDGKWVCTALLRAQELLAPLSMGDGGEEASRPLLTHRPGCQGEGTDPLAQSGPVPAHCSAAGCLSSHALLTRCGNEGGASWAVLCQTRTRAIKAMPEPMRA